MEKITVEIARQRVEEIQRVERDDEHAHILEDDLHSDFIKCIAEGLYTEQEVKEVAAIVLTTATIEFSRWHA